MMRTLLTVAAIALLSAPAAPKEFMLAVGSRTFSDNHPLPKKSAYDRLGCPGKNVSPELHWSTPPEGTKSFAITMWDRDATAPGGWWHWAVYGIPASVRSLPEGKPLGLPATASFGTPGYGGPCPPPGKVHHYRFVVYALDVAQLRGVSSAKTAPQLVKAMRGHVLAEGSMVGLYKH